jgi:hypothetical protein
MLLGNNSDGWNILEKIGQIYVPERERGEGEGVEMRRFHVQCRRVGEM